MALQFPSQLAAQDIQSDSTLLNFPDSALVDSGSVSNSSLEEPVSYLATDSMIFDLSSQKIYLYNKSQVDYGSVILKSDYIAMDFSKNEVYAKGAPDSTGNIAGKPNFKDGDQTFDATELTYNFDTKKGLITEAKTEEADGHIQGKRVKIESDEVLYIKNAEYCPCEDANAGTYLKSSRLKIIQDDKIITGPAYLVVANIPTPLVLPFGILPNKQGKASGIIIPQPGSSPTQGFYIQEGGYYWTVNDYVDVALTGNFFTRGSWGTKLKSNYKARYRYGGNLSLEYNVLQNGLRELPTSSQDRSFFVRWDHRQDQKAKPNSQFSASVSAGSRNNFANNFVSANQDYLTNTFKSSINYNKTFANTPFRMSLSASHDQNSLDTTQVFNIVLPQVALTMSRVNPFRNSTKKWIKDIGLSYTGNFKNRFQTTETALRKGIIYDQNDLNPIDGSFNIANSQNGLQHRIPLKTNFKLLKHLTFSPSLSFTETWYLRKLDYSWNEDRQEVNVDTVAGFNRFGSVSLSSSLGTNIYGMYTFKSEKISAIRHTMSPNVSFTYVPNLFNGLLNYQSDTIGNERTATGYEGFTFGGPSGSESGRVRLSLANNIEMKKLVKNDSTSTYKKVKLIEQLSVSTSYDIFKDSLQWDPLSVNASFRLFNKMSVRVNATFDQYAINANTGTSVTDKYEFEENGKLFRTTNFAVALSYSLSQSTFKNINFASPWSANISYKYNESKPYRVTRITQTINFQGKMMLTSKWDVGGSTNYDIRSKAFAYTSVNVYRDLNCWELSFSFIPFGLRKSYSFKLNVKPAMLKDLKLERKRDWYDYQ